MLLRSFAAVWLAPFAIAASAQSPSDGGVQDGQYVNAYFHISYAWPQILHPVPTSDIKPQAPPGSTTEYLLFVARQGEEPYGVVMMAEKPNPHPPMSNGENDSQSFLDDVKKLWKPEGHARILAETHSTGTDGLAFYEIDYTYFGEFTSAIAVQVGEFQIVFRCSAKSITDLAEMTKSVLRMNRSR